ncbi:hypothetical protein AZI87_01920 [Bdellovibrio bacteriovorus]|uniref:Hemerythrin-like domain-containing protein n=1 Tax=Bdellovibrio bacteriovorus TaxID=959 RepID=A0A150WFU4_BDEBC|nr:hemerythrin domain-containing protein [Bdellovibrio bacteriovorus]KYG61862.1 hypothetical protein AZI85_06510 [Bdellovibrio bacteriovorus]KYG68046.1 hypothetical protein AZI87_01920 [Bdellovibrio bacteriovorus]
MLIYEALRKDHDDVKELLARLLELDETREASKERSDLIEQIVEALIPHARAEEAVLYNSLRMLEASKDEAMHAYREHMEAEGLLRVLQVQDKANLPWKATARKLRQSLEHHIQEEEGHMFTTAQGLFTDEEAEAMTDEFLDMKMEVSEKGFMGTTLDMITNLMPPEMSDALRNNNNRHIQ